MLISQVFATLKSMSKLSHFDEQGASRMVNVGSKAVTDRVARASGIVRMQAATRQLIVDRGHAKGDVLEVARLAGIMASKRDCRPNSALPSAGIAIGRARFAAIGC